MSAFARGTRPLAPRRILFSERRTYATTTQLPRPPLPTEEPPTETFSAPSKPKLYYTRPSSRQDLPQIQVLPSVCHRLIYIKDLKCVRAETMAIHSRICCTRGIRMGCLPLHSDEPRTSLEFRRTPNFANGTRRRGTAGCFG